MMFSRDAMTASATEAATPPKIPRTTNNLLRLGVTISHSPPSPSPTRAARASEPARDSVAQTKDSTAKPRSRAHSKARHSARNLPSQRSRRPSCSQHLAHPTGLAFAIQHFTAQAHAKHRAEEQHEAEKHREQRP